MHRLPIHFVLLAALALVASDAAAQQPPSRWYLGVAYGETSLHHEAADLAGSALVDVRLDDSDSGWKLLAGYRLGDHFAVEGGYVDLNNDVDGTTTASGTTSDDNPVSVDIDEPRAMTVAMLGLLPIGDSATAFARAGFAAWEADLTTFQRSTSFTESESGVDAVFGAGLQYRVATRAEVRLEWERYVGLAGDDFDLASVGVTLRLGGGSR